MYLVCVCSCVFSFPVTLGFIYSSISLYSSCAAFSLQGSITSKALCSLVSCYTHTQPQKKTISALTPILQQKLPSLLLPESFNTAKDTISVPCLPSTTKNSLQILSLQFNYGLTAKMRKKALCSSHLFQSRKSCLLV